MTGVQTCALPISCDNEAVRQHLLSVYGKDFDADEFLRKFFNTAFNIPKFIDIDLNQYVKKLLILTKIPEFKDIYLTDVIIYAFRDNPREIKQFINSLICVHRLGVARGSVQNLSISFLAKLLVMRQKFPNFYSILEDRALRSPANLDSRSINTLITEYKEVLSIKYNVNTDDLRIQREVDNLMRFHKYTSSIDKKDIDIYLTLRQSEEEKNISEWSSYVIAADTGDLKSAVNIFKGIKDGGKIDKFESLLEARLVKNKDGGLTAGQFVSITIKVMQELNYPLKNFLFLASKHFSALTKNLDASDLFEPKMVFEFWHRNIKPETQKELVTPFVDFLSKIDPNTDLSEKAKYSFSLLDIISNEPKIFTHSSASIRKCFESKLFDYRFITRIRSDEAKKEFITNKAIELFISGINPNIYFDGNDFRVTLDYLRGIDLDASQFYLSLGQLNSVALALSSEHDSDKKYVFSEFLSLFLDQYKENLTVDKHPELVDIIQSISNRIANYYSETSTYSDKSKMMMAIEVLTGLPFNGQIPSLNNRIEDFIKNSGDEDMLIISDEVMKKWATSFPVAFIERSISRPNILLEKELFRHFNNEQRTGLVNRFLDNNLDPLDIISKLNYEISNMPEVMDKLLDKLKIINSERLALVFESLKKMGINSYADKVQRFCDLLVIYRQEKMEDKKSIDKTIKKQALFNNAQLIILFPDHKHNSQ